MCTFQYHYADFYSFELGWQVILTSMFYLHCHLTWLKLVQQVAEVQKSLCDIGYDLNDLQRLVEGLVSFFHEVCCMLCGCVCTSDLLQCVISTTHPLPRSSLLKKESKFSIQDFFFRHLFPRKKRKGFLINLFFMISRRGGHLSNNFIYVAFSSLLPTLLMLSFFVSGWEDRYAGRKTGRTSYLIVCVCIYTHYYIYISSFYMRSHIFTNK